MASKKSDVAVILPKPVEWDFGGRVFVQKPLSLRGPTGFLDVLSEVVEKAGNTPAFQRLMESNAEEQTIAELAPTVLSLVSGVPDALPKLLAAILGEPREAEWIADHARPADALKVFSVFVDQNDPQEFMGAFFVLRGKLAPMLPSPIPEATTTDSPTS